MVDNFLTEEESDALLKMIKKNGYDKGMFGPCTNAVLRKNGHPHFESSNKLCFKMSNETLHNEMHFKMLQSTDKGDANQGNLPFYGDCGDSPCSAKTDPQDARMLESIFSKVRALWSTTRNPRPHASAVLLTGTSPPLQPHQDNGNLISFVLYLTSGGASTVFPKAGVTITPQKGALAFWLNTLQDGSINPMATHAVQAHPGYAGERATVNMFIRDVTPDEFLMSQK